MSYAYVSSVATVQVCMYSWLRFGIGKEPMNELGKSSRNKDGPRICAHDVLFCQDNPNRL